MMRITILVLALLFTLGNSRDATAQSSSFTRGLTNEYQYHSCMAFFMTSGMDQGNLGNRFGKICHEQASRNLHRELLASETDIGYDYNKVVKKPKPVKPKKKTKPPKVPRNNSKPHRGTQAAA